MNQFFWLSEEKTCDHVADQTEAVDKLAMRISNDLISPRLAICSAGDRRLSWVILGFYSAAVFLSPV